MIQILRKEGWILNPNDKVVNAILKRCEINDGECPCHNESVDKHCPCTDYKEKDECHCGLYVKQVASLNMDKLPEGMSVEAAMEVYKAFTTLSI